MSRIFNFSAGPAVLPEEVLLEAQANLVDYQGHGMSIMEASHRGKEYDPVHEEALANLKELLAVPETHEILFMQGGASGQFALIPMNLLGAGQTADYVDAGSWGIKAIQEARLVGSVNVAAKTRGELPARMPSDEDLKLTPGAAYLHTTSNETIEGAQMKSFPVSEAPLICDMSSDILSREIPVANFGLIYAGAQKNLGPSGVTIVIIRKDLADRAPATLPTILRYKTHLDNNSLYHTPPTFAIYMVMLVTRWIKANGGVSAMRARNEAKAAKIYSAIDESDFYRGTAAVPNRSTMNVTFRLPTEELENQFLKRAAAEKMSGLKGHRSVGGIRASIYNAFPEAGVDALVSLMRDFRQTNG